MKRPVIVVELEGEYETENERLNALATYETVILMMKGVRQLTVTTDLTFCDIVQLDELRSNH